MSLSDYVPSFRDVRGVLGVSEDELPDTDLDLRVYELSLLDALDEISNTLVADYGAVDQNNMTAAEETLVDAVHVYSTYFAASDRMGTLELFAPRTISDGKATVQRQSATSYDEIRERISKSLAKAKSDLLEAVGVVTVATSVENSYGFLLAGNNDDPVTGGT